MTLSNSEIAQLNRVITALQRIVAQPNKSGKGRVTKAISKKPARRARRSGKELVAFRRMLIAERKKGVPVAQLAKRHGISTTYIYQL